MTIFDYLGLTERCSRNENGDILLDRRDLSYIVHQLGCYKYWDDDTDLIPKEVFDRFCEYSITAAQDERFSELDDVRRPYYRMRGKPVTKEQAFDIIRRTDEFLAQDIDVEKIRFHKDFVGGGYFNNWLIAKNHYPQGYGWIHVDGTVGGNAITQKYPEIEELVQEWLLKLMAFPYLNLIIAITNWNECSPAEWEERKPREDETFENAVILGIRIHDKSVELLNREDTLKCYQEYDSKYGQPAEKFEPRYYQDHHLTQVDEAYLRRCIESYGLNADKELKQIPEYIWKGDGTWPI